MPIIHYGRTPWQLYTTAEEGTLAHHDLERCSAMRQRMIRYKAFITEHAGLEMILFCIGVNTSDVFPIGLFRSLFYVFIPGRHTVRITSLTDGATYVKTNIYETA